MGDKYRDSDLLALPLALAVTFLLCYITEMVLPKEAAIVISLLGAITFGRYARRIVRMILK